MASEHDTWTPTLNGNLELRRGGMTRGFVVGSFWRTDNQPLAMGSEKDTETAKIALVAACDAHDLRVLS